MLLLLFCLISLVGGLIRIDRADSVVQELSGGFAALTDVALRFELDFALGINVDGDLAQGILLVVGNEFEAERSVLELGFGNLVRTLDGGRRQNVLRLVGLLELVELR